MRKSRKSAILYSPISIGVLTLIALFLAHASWGVFAKERESAAAAAKAASDLVSLHDRQKKLEIENADLGTNTGVESEIRQKYSVSKPNEDVYVIVDGESTTTKGTSTNAENKGGWWGNVTKFFGH